MYSPSQSGGGRPKQSRIVINVGDTKQTGGARGPLRGRRRTLALVGLVIAGALLLTLIGGLIWWQSYKKSPAYSLALLVDAAQRDDVQTVDEYLDTERVAQSLAPQVLNKAMASAGGMGALPAPRKQIEAALPNLLPAMHDEVRAELVRGVKEMSAQGGRMPFFLMALAAPRMWDNIKEDGDTAVVTVKRADNPATELTMQRNENRWKVVGLKDDQLANAIAARVVGSLTAQPAPNAAPTDNNTRRPRRRRNN
ncbi:MAG TPA: DUF2939 domain-containing protein [Pyrinomonadaceae bacterium]|nr:DUF2939 domain-containing protein [Pyrinomonadaceae bacterium]